MAYTTDLTKKVNVHLEHGTVCLTTDRWSNIRNEPIVNCMATSPLSTLFLELVSTGEQSHNSEWIASDIEHVMNCHRTTTFAGVVTDNTSTNRNAWEKLLRKHPSAFFQGCTSHGLNLFVKDVFGATKTKKGKSEELPIWRSSWVYCFVQDIVNLFHINHSLKVQLNAEQMKSSVLGLVCPGPTRWGSIKGCCETLLMSEKSIACNRICKRLHQGNSGSESRAHPNQVHHHMRQFCCLAGEVTCHPYLHQCPYCQVSVKLGSHGLWGMAWLQCSPSSINNQMVM